MERKRNIFLSTDWCILTIHHLFCFIYVFHALFFVQNVHKQSTRNIVLQLATFSLIKNKWISQSRTLLCKLWPSDRLTWLCIRVCSCECMNACIHSQFPPTYMHKTKACTQRLPAPLTPIIQPPKQRPPPLAESFWVIFSAIVAMETAEQRKDGISAIIAITRMHRGAWWRARRGESMTRSLSLTQIWCRIKQSEEENPGFSTTVDWCVRVYGGISST